MKQEELDNILELHKKWLNNEAGGKRASLRYADLQYANLRRANLRRADLAYASLIGANLRRANLAYANINWASLIGANLRHANLEKANLERANLRHANLEKANLERANLRGANLSYANLQDTDLDFSSFPLWCGSFNMKNADRLAKQLLSHIARLQVNDKQLKSFIDKIPKQYKNDICKRHSINEV